MMTKPIVLDQTSILQCIEHNNKHTLSYSEKLYLYIERMNFINVYAVCTIIFLQWRVIISLLPLPLVSSLLFKSFLLRCNSTVIRFPSFSYSSLNLLSRRSRSLDWHIKAFLPLDFDPLKTSIFKRRIIWWNSWASCYYTRRFDLMGVTSITYWECLK